VKFLAGGEYYAWLGLKPLASAGARVHHRATLDNTNMKFVIKAAAALTLSLGIAVVIAYAWSRSDEAQAAPQAASPAAR
jgi:hypothetical protein